MRSVLALFSWMGFWVLCLTPIRLAMEQSMIVISEIRQMPPIKWWRSSVGPHCGVCHSAGVVLTRTLLETPQELLLLSVQATATAESLSSLSLPTPAEIF